MLLRSYRPVVGAKAYIYCIRQRGENVQKVRKKDTLNAAEYKVKMFKLESISVAIAAHTYAAGNCLKNLETTAGVAAATSANCQCPFSF